MKIINRDMAKIDVQSMFNETNDKINEIIKKIDVLEQKIISVESSLQNKIHEIESLINVIDEDYYSLKKEVIKKVDIFNEEITNNLAFLKDNLISLSKVALKNRKEIEKIAKNKE